MEQGQMEESLIYYQQLAELQPNDYEPHYQMAEIYRSLEKPKKADEEFATALALLEATPQDRTTLIAEARIHGLLGEKELSDQEFDRLLEQDPRDIELANLYIDTLIENKSIKKAARLAEDYLASNPTNKTLLRNTSRILAHEQKYDQAKTILKSLRKSYPEDESLDIDYAYLLYEMGDWYRAWPRFTKLAEKYPGNKSIQTTLDELFMLYRPQIVGGFGFRRTGGDNLFGPYVRFLYPFNSEWSFSTFYMLDRNIAHVGTLNPSYVSYTNIVDLSARYTPIRNLTIDLGLMNQFEDSAAAPAPHLLVDWIHSEIGRFTLEATYNKLLDDPVEALYFEGRQSPLIVRYENFLFNERLFVRAAYESRWYRVDSDKMPTNQGDDWGRDDIADVGFDWYVHKKPDIRIGYSFHFSRLHQRYNYVTLIPLIQASDRSDINFGFFHEWNKWLSTDIGGFVGYDPKRNLDFGDLYGFNVTPRIKVSKRLEFLGHYEYSSESLTDNVGTYQYFNAEVLYRF